MRRGPLALRLRRVARPAWPAALTRREPLSRFWGFDRGTPVDRYSIERFLQDHSRDIRGAVLEIQDRAYTNRFGVDVDRSEVLDVDSKNPLATIVADLASADAVPDASFDCFILTQTLQLIYDVPAAIACVHRALRPGGVVLVTAPGISQIDRGEWAPAWCWSFTAVSLERLFGEVFDREAVFIEQYGNVLAATAFLQGLATEELTRDELDPIDKAFPVIYVVRARKREETSA